MGRKYVFSEVYGVDPESSQVGTEPTDETSHVRHSEPPQVHHDRDVCMTHVLDAFVPMEMGLNFFYVTSRSPRSVS